MGSLQHAQKDKLCIWL